mgnify:CR=1 FL=1
MESSTTLDAKQYTKEQKELCKLRDQQEKTLGDYYAKKLKYYDFSHIVKNIMT